MLNQNTLGLINFCTQHIIFLYTYIFIYIDNVIILRDGTKVLFLEFAHTVNQNTLDLTFTSEMNEKEIHFLNLIDEKFNIQTKMF